MTFYHFTLPEIEARLAHNIAQMDEVKEISWEERLATVKKEWEQSQINAFHDTADDTVEQ